jgi:hypothetical protein
MTARSAPRVVRLAWGVGLCSLGLVAANLVLLALDWKAIDSQTVQAVPYLVQAPIVAILGLLIAIRRPTNSIGWLLLAVAAAEAICAFAVFVALRGLLAGASPRGWVVWPAVVFGIAVWLGPLLLAFVILLFPNGRLLPGPRWRWATRVVVALVTVAVASSLVAVAPIQLSTRFPGMANPLAVPALDGLTNGNPLAGTQKLKVVAPSPIHSHSCTVPPSSAFGTSVVGSRCLVLKQMGHTSRRPFAPA